MAKPDWKRRLAAIVAIGLADCSRLTEANEKGALTVAVKRLKLGRWISAAILATNFHFQATPEAFAEIAGSDASTTGPRGVIAGVPRSWPPQYSLDENGRPIGFAIDIMEEIAARADVRVTYQVMDSFAAVSEAMNEGLIDIIPNSGITPERQAKFAFTSPVETFVVSIFVRDDDLDIHERADLAGHRVAAVEFNVGHRLIQNRENIEVVVHRDARTALFSLLSGQVDAFIFPKPVLLNLARQIGVDDHIKIVGEPLRELKRAIRVQKGRPKLLATLNRAVEDFVGTPAYQRIYVKWYGEPTPYWTLTRILWALAGLLTVIVCVMAIWRYQSIVKLNRKLRESSNKRERVEASLRLTQFTLDHAGDTVFWLGESGGFEYVNQSGQRMLGYSWDELSAMHIWDVDPDVAQADWPSILARAISRGHHTFEAVHVTKDGSEVPVEVSTTPVSFGDRQIICSFSRDITERKRADKEVWESEERFASLIKNSNALIYIKDLDGRFRLVNPAFEEWTGISAEDANGRTVHDLFPTVASGVDAVERVVIKTGESVDEKFRLPRRDGAMRTVLTTKFPILNANGVTGAVGTISVDVTEQIEIEERLHQSQKMEAIGQLTGGVAHDFNNLLAVVQGNAELLAETAGIDDSMVGAIIRASMRGEELTQRLLAFSRQQPLRPQSIDLAELTAGTSELLKRTLGETIVIETVGSSDLWSALADPGQVENALLNLAINARDAMPGGGQLTIECVNAHLEEDYTARNPETTAGDYVVLAVSDTGVGMTAEVRERAFEPFFTTKEVGQGSGLGLSMVYGFAKQSGGHVAIYSEVGRGTTVKLYLPRTEQALGLRERDLEEQLPRGQNELVLVVEDDPDVRALTVSMLERLGYQVVDAADAESARAVLEKEKVVLVLSDLVLPGGMSGPEFAEAAQQRDSGLKVIYMSGYTAEAANRNGALDAGRTLLSKPFRRQQLAIALRVALDR